MKVERKKIKKNFAEIKNSLETSIAKYILAGFGLVVGLAWNEAIKESINVFFPSETETLVAKFIYAIVITIFVVIVTFILVKVFKTEDDE